MNTHPPQENLASLTDSASAPSPDFMNTFPDRPLSPHLQIYRWQMTMVMSILHRMSGVALAVGVLYLLWWLIAAALGAESYHIFTSFSASWFGQFLLFGWSLCFYYHMANGIRHLLWDHGRCLSLKKAYQTGYGVWGFTILTTLATWGYVWFS